MNPAIHYSGAIDEYKADSGTKSIKVHVKSSSVGKDEFVFSGAKAYPKKPTTAPLSPPRRVSRTDTCLNSVAGIGVVATL